MDPLLIIVSGGKYPDIEKRNPVKCKKYTPEETSALSNNNFGFVSFFYFFLGVRRYFPDCLGTRVGVTAVVQVHSLMATL